MFGPLAQSTGLREDTIDVTDGASGADLIRAVGERYPDAARVLERVSVAVNHEVVPPERKLDPADEIALLPPVSGGAQVIVGLRERPSVDEAMEAVSAPGAGGTAVFLGTVRDNADAGRVERLDYDAYEDMAVTVMAEIATEAVAKWGLAAVAVLHGVGSFGVGETTMVVACSAAHREEAFDACRYVVDEVKRRVPVWKKESGSWGERWIE
jgi:molybdopterin synthase catalytic subunit